MSEYTTIKFSDSYSLANSIWKILFEASQSYVDRMFETYFYPCCEHRACQFAKPNRWTLLHHFIHRYYWDSYEEFEHQYDDMRDTIITEYEAVLNFYEIPYSSISIPEEMSEDYHRKTAKIICSLRSLLPSSRIAHDTFQLLFEDRVSLMKFNQGVARVVRDHLKKRDCPEIAESDGVFRRVYLPAWVKRAIFYRDKGRCVVCGKDLTGTVLTGEEVHYDHIVPLAAGGANDPTNFQLMCRDCNLSKAQKTGTSDKYQTYWNIDDESLTEARKYFEGRVGLPTWIGCVQESDKAA